VGGERWVVVVVDTREIPPQVEPVAWQLLPASRSQSVINKHWHFSLTFKARITMKQMLFCSSSLECKNILLCHIY